MVVATHVGVVPLSARTYPAVPAVVVESAPVPLPYVMAPLWMLDQPVPPMFTPRVVEAETAPLEFVTRTPEGEPETVRLVALAVPKYPIPLAVMFVVDAPPDIVKRPLVIVEEALERKPFMKVVRPLALKTPKVAVCENRLVELAVVEKKAVDVAPPWPIENTVVDALVTASNRLPVPQVVSLLYGVVVPMPTEVPKSPVRQARPFAVSPKSRRLVTVGIRDEPILELKYVLSVVVASPNVVVPSTENVDAVVVDKVTPPTAVREFAKTSPSASIRNLAELLTERERRFESVVAEAGLITKEAPSGLASLAPDVHEEKV